MLALFFSGSYACAQNVTRPKAVDTEMQGITFPARCSETGLSAGRAYPGAKSWWEQVPEGIMIYYDFTGGGRFVGLEPRLKLPYARGYTFTFDVFQKTEIYGSVLEGSGGSLHTPSKIYEPGKNQTLIIRSNGPFVPDKGRETTGLAEKIFFGIRRNPSLPLKGKILLRSYELRGAKNRKEHQLRRGQAAVNRFMRSVEKSGKIFCLPNGMRRVMRFLFRILLCSLLFLMWIKNSWIRAIFPFVHGFIREPTAADTVISHL